MLSVWLTLPRLTQVSENRLRQLVLCLMLAGCGTEAGGRDGAPWAADSLVARSQRFVAAIGDAIGDVGASEARYFAGDYVIFLDKFSPHLKLFTTEGVPLWAGGRSGGGPTELTDPQVLLPSGDSVLVLQRGRVSVWRLEDDSLEFAGAASLAPEYAPLGATIGCRGEWLVYARNGRQLPRSWDGEGDSGVLDNVLVLRLDGDRASLSPWWSTPMDPRVTPYTGHTAALMGRSDSTIALLYRVDTWSAGEVMQLDCSGRVTYRFSEKSLATGDSVSVVLPQARALEWTAGVIATPAGVIVALHRYKAPGFYDVETPEWKTEVFTLKGDRYLGSRLMDSQWVLMDYDEALGALLSTNMPVPHFVRVPLDELLPASGRGGGS